MKRIVPDNAVLIPDDAERVFEGILFDVYQWPQKRYDGSTVTFEMLRRPDTINTIVVRGTQILLIEQQQPLRGAYIALPGGRGDAGEDWQDGAKRELAEETGLECSAWRLVHVDQPQQKIEWFVAIYVAADIVNESKTTMDGGEKITPIWREYAEVRQAVLAGEIRSLRHLRSIFETYTTADALLKAPEFDGRAIERNA